MADTVHRAAIALGSNLGDRSDHIERALEALDARPDVELVERSTLIETTPVGPIEQGPYLNAAALVDTTLDAQALLAMMLAIEADRGRVRPREPQWGPRTLDLDLLLYGDQIIAREGLTVPHPRMHERAFVLVPLAQIAPDLIHPVVRMTIGELADSLSKRLPE